MVKRRKPTIIKRPESSRSRTPFDSDETHSDETVNDNKCNQIVIPNIERPEQLASIADHAYVNTSTEPQDAINLSNDFEHRVNSVATAKKSLNAIKNVTSFEMEQMNSLTCPVCMTSFPRKSNLIRHKKIHASGQEYPCPKDCGLRFVNKVSLGLHVERIHYGNRRENENGPPFKCLECGKQFSRVYDRNQHEKLHSGECKNVCSECGKAFSTGSALNWHKQVHLDAVERKSYLCDVCGKNYYTKSALEEHQRRHLGDEGKEHTCDICGARFFRRSHLKQHLDIHRCRNSAEQIKCDLCDKLFPTKIRLESHKRTVHVRPDKLFPCILCDKPFKTPRDLRRHHKIHAGIKEHVCTYCSRAFTQKENLVSHIRTHTGEKPYACEHCSASFAQAQQLKSHSRSSHGGTSSPVKRIRRNGSFEGIDIEQDAIDIEQGLMNAQIEAMHESMQSFTYSLVPLQ